MAAGIPVRTIRAVVVVPAADPTGKDQMADAKELKARKDELEARKESLIDEFLATAVVQHALAPLEREIALLEEKLNPKKDEEKK